MDVTLAAETGRPQGSRASRRLVREGKVPGVVYGLDQEAVPVAVAWPELRAALTTEAGLNALITLDIDGTEDLTIVKELQRDPVRRDVIHVDFLRVSRDAEIEVEVPIVLEGTADLVEREGGTVNHSLFTLAVYAKPGRIPNEIVVDISGLELGEAIRVADLVLPEGARTEADPEEPVVLGQATRATVESGAEGEEGEAAEGAPEASAEAPSGGDEGGDDAGGDEE